VVVKRDMSNDILSDVKQVAALATAAAALAS